MDPTTSEVRRAPAVLLDRISGPLDGLFACGIARRGEDGALELLLEPDEVEAGGMAAISMRVPVGCPSCAPGTEVGCEKCGGAGVVRELFSAWLAVRPGVADGAVLSPSAQLPGVVRPVSFRVRRA